MTEKWGEIHGKLDLVRVSGEFELSLLLNQILFPRKKSSFNSSRLFLFAVFLVVTKECVSEYIF